MYSTMYCDVLYLVRYSGSCAYNTSHEPEYLTKHELHMNQNTSPNTSQYICEYIPIHPVIHPSTSMMYWDVLHGKYMTNTLK